MGKAYPIKNQETLFFFNISGKLVWQRAQVVENDSNLYTREYEKLYNIKNPLNDFEV